MNDMNQQRTNADRMRVLRIAHASLTPTLRERERAVARGFQDVDLEVVTTVGWREAEVDVKAMDDDLFPVIKAKPLFSKHVQLFAYDPRPIISALRRHRPHIVDLNAEPYSVACAEILTLCSWFAPQAKIILQVCQNIYKNYPPPFCWFERRALKRADAMNGCSETVRELLRAKGFEKPVAIVPFGVNVDAYTPRIPSPRLGPLTIGFVGRMLPGKGLNILADALNKLKDREWQLLVVGDGPERQNFERSLAENGLTSRARFTGAISYDTVPPLFQEMDMLVIPTETTKRIREQFGRVIVEAMASGVPVIGSTCGAIPEVISDAGLVFPEGDADALAAAIGRLLSDAGLREEFSRAGRPHVEQHYSWERVAEKTYEQYCQMLREPAQQRVSQELEFAP
jgi:glycosyltransferase involved in cell wall biosynthesis